MTNTSSASSAALLALEINKQKSEIRTAKLAGWTLLALALPLTPLFGFGIVGGVFGIFLLRKSKRLQRELDVILAANGATS